MVHRTYIEFDEVQVSEPEGIGLLRPEDVTVEEMVWAFQMFSRENE